MQDNARTHTARVVIAYLGQESIDVMDQLAISITGLESNRTSAVGHVPTMGFTSYEPNSNRTDPNRGSDRGMECHRSGIHSHADPDHA